MSRKTQSISEQELQRDLNKALVFHQEEKLAQAEALYKEILNTAPNNAEVLNLLASVQLTMEKYREALINAQNAISYNKSRADFYLTLASAEQSHGNFNHALNAYQCAQALAPNEATIYKCLGDLYQEDGQWSAALNEYNKSLDQKPNDLESHLKIAKNYELEKDLEKAFQHYDLALKISPKSIEALLRKGNLYKSQGKAQQALNQYLIALSYKKDSDGVMNNIGSAYFDLEDYKNALKYFKLSIDINAHSLDSQLNIALVYKRLGDPEEALLHLKQARKISPQTAIIYFYMGKIFLEEADLKSAERFFVKCLDFNPQSYHAHNLLSQVYMKQGFFGKASDSAKSSFDLAQSKETLINYLLSLKANHQYEEALALCEEHYETYSDSESLNVLAGTIYQTVHDNEKALSCFKKAQSINPDNVSVKHLLAALAGEEVETAPHDYVADLFDSYSELFDEQLTTDLQYKTPWLIAELLEEAFEEDFIFNKALDLGCGTGLSGLAIRDLVKTMDGVDLSSKMLEKAREKDLYGNLACQDIESYLAEQVAGTYDLTLATDVFVYLGNLEKTFYELGRCLSKGAHFAFSTELLEDDLDYKLCESGRFAHNPSYILALSEKYSFQLLKSKTIKLRQSSHGWIVGEIYLLKKLL